MLLFIPLYTIQPERFTIAHGIIISAILISVWFYFLFRLRLGIIFRELAFMSMIRGYASVVLIGVCCLITVAILYPWMTTRLDSIYFCLIFGLSNFLLLILFKYAFYRGMRLIRRKGFNSRQIIIIANTNNCMFLSTFDRVKDWGYKLAGIFSDDPELLSRFPKQKIYPTTEARDFILQHPVDDIFYCLPINNINIQSLIDLCNTIGVTLHIMQHSEQNIHGRYALKTEFNEQFITYQTVTDKYLRLKIKDLFDLFFSLTVIVASAPVTLFIAILIKMDGGPVFFKQERIGRNGRRFMCYKFRSMVPNAEDLKKQLAALNEADGPAFKIKDDPRVTKIGKFLRKTSLDELPQFINVVLGNMSIVGPRPPLLSEVEQYEAHQLRRLSMKPGITCTWQVWGRHNVSFEEWIHMDLEYIDNWSIRLDAKIILATFGVILKAGNN
nr:sugar transferase [Paludibacter sp.]